jgi:hypothetical protein
MRRQGCEIRTNPVGCHDTKDIDHQLDGKLDRLVEISHDKGRQTPLPRLEALLSSECHTAASISIEP